MAGVIILLLVAIAVAAPAQTFTPLATVNTTSSPLIQGMDGNFYGVTPYGGVNQYNCYIGAGCGTAFRVTPGGTVTVVHTFCTQPSCPDGWWPTSLVRAGNGNFYGTTAQGGANSSVNCPYGCGTVFEITPTGKLTTLYNFCALSNCADGDSPQALMQAFGGGFYGDFYGTTSYGGANLLGTVFRITPQGGLTTLYSFCTPMAGCPDGWYSGQLIQTPGGNFFGAAPAGGSNCPPGNCGAIFRMTPTGTVTALQIFDAPTAPNSPLVQGADGFFYGTTAYGGNDVGGCSEYGCGTVFKISPAGKVTTLYNFCPEVGCTDGSFPVSGLVLATDGNFYGTTEGEGTPSLCSVGFCPGTLFVISPSGALTTLYEFCSQPDCADGVGSEAALVQGTDGKFYGTSVEGSDSGIVFSLDVGLAPFVTFLVSTGKVGQTVGILGQGFTGTTAVSFNGTPATFTVKSDTFLTAVVPAGATTGFVTVTTPGGSLRSNIAYRVTQ